uniref:golgin subfamily A member 2-like n=1 Tax=Macaca mulatta TaxID=9544 RepID=UPI000D318653|nr:golgin subfamily A member 2-like [Macaca nemestrina]XP_028702402.1 golgin subfamily A member 2-like [Macaca mulatta]
MLSVPEDLESWEAMVAFFKSTGASAQEEQAQLREQVKEQTVCCQRLVHLVASAQKEPEAAVPAPGTGGKSVSGETHRALQEVMEKLEVSESWHGPRSAGVGQVAAEIRPHYVDSRVALWNSWRRRQT